MNQRLQLRGIRIFEQAVQQPISTLEPWLSEQCGDDADLLAYVRNLLGADEHTSFLRTGAAIKGLSEDLVGSDIGAYHLIEKLGEGGMGAAYLAERVDGQFDHQVAIKLIRSDFLSAEATLRFQRERQILAGLQHNNIAQLYDGGATDQGMPYVVMEYVNGDPLGTYIVKNSVHFRQLLKMFCDICSAVQFAHQSLIVHRDLKPSNVLVDENGVAKLLDFGIAKQLSETSQDQTIALALTPAYASPEQITGVLITTATDVYSLGVMLYECLTGERPYSLKGLTPAQTEREITQTETPRPSSRQTRFSPLVDADLDAVVLKALAKEPERRYPTAGALLNDLQNYLAGKPVSAQLDTPGYRFKKFVRRHMPVTVATGIAVLSLVVTLAVSLSQTQIANKQLARAEAVGKYLEDILTSPDPTWNTSIVGGPNVTLVQVLESAERQLDTDLLEQPDVRVDLYDTFGNAHMWLDNREAAIRTREKAMALSLREFPGDASREIWGLFHLAEVYEDWGESETSIPLYEQALDLYKSAGVNIEDIHLLFNDAAEAYGRAQRFADAIESQRESLREAERYLPMDSNHWLNLFGNLGSFLIETQQLQEAETALKHALTMELVDKSDFYAAKYHLVLGQLYLFQHKPDKAVSQFAKAVSLTGVAQQTHVLALEDTVNARLWLAYAQISSDDIGDLELARVSIGRLQEQYIGALTEQDTWLFHVNASRLQQKNGQPQLAQQSLQKAAELVQKLETPLPPSVIRLVFGTIAGDIRAPSRLAK